MMLAAIAIPGQLATARLARMPPQTGLYAFAAGSLAFAAFGANPFMSVAADSTIAPIFAGALTSLAVIGTAYYVEVANLMDDPRIAELCADIERHLTAHDPEQLRNSARLRESVADEADAILRRMQGAFA